MARLAVLICSFAVAAHAHVSERALVMLLPTDIYIRSGVMAVVLTVLVLAATPPRLIHRIFRHRSTQLTRGATLPSVISFLVLWAAILIGIYGPRDPLTNALPLLFWTVFWIVLPVVQALFGDLWASINPWSGPYRMLKLSPLWTLPAKFGAAPAIVTFMAAAMFSVIHIAPDDPAQLAGIVAGYWAVTFAMMLIFGEGWLARGEGATVFLHWISRLSPLSAPPLTHATPGWTIAVLLMVALGVGSFDGLNETFWWLGVIGVNPLEFPGRSAVTAPNGIGLLTGVLALIAVFLFTNWLGLMAIRRRDLFAMLTPRMALTLIPIALGYHIAHYLTAFLVNMQYLAVALTDPFANGSDYLGLGRYYVSTGFFNTTETVRMIWLVQAGSIVLAHMIAILMAHAIALNAIKSHRQAVISQLPVAAFMVAYTLFGLWLLATPTGL